MISVIRARLPIALSLIFLAVLAGFFRFYRLDSFPLGLHYDEAMNGNNALMALHTGSWQVFYPENYGREGLFINLQALSVSLFGTTIWALRSVAAVMGILAVLGLYMLVRDLYEERLALIAGILHAVFLWPVITSRIGIRPQMSEAVFLWMLWAFFRAYELTGKADTSQIAPTPFNRKLSRDKYLWCILAGALLGIGLNTYIAFRIVPLLLLGILFIAWRARHMSASCLVRRSLALLVTATAFIAPLAFYFMLHPTGLFARMGTVSAFGEPWPLLHIVYNVFREFTVPFFTGTRTWLNNYNLYSAIAGPFFAWGAWIIFRRLKNGWKRRGSGRGRLQPTPSLVPAAWREIFLALWIAIGSLPGVLGASWEFPHYLRLILISPAVSLIAGIGLLQVQTWLGRRLPKYPRLPSAILACLLCAIVLQNYNLYFNHFVDDPQKKADFHYAQYQLAQKLEQTSSKKHRLIVVTDSGYVLGIPFEAGDIAYLTNTLSPEDQERKNIHYTTIWKACASDSIELIPLPD